MATAKKLPSGHWRTRVTYTVNGKRKSESFTATTKKESERMAAVFLLDYEKSKENSKIHMTLEEAMNLYIETKSCVLSPSTITGYRVIVKNHLKSLMSLDINEITRIQIQKAINVEASKNSAKTVKNTHGLLSAVMHEYRPDFVFNTTLPQKEKTNIRIPTNSELSLLLSACENDDLYIAIILGAFEGMRRSEICALTWDDVDFNKRLITISKAAVADENNEIVIKAPKSYSGNRVLPIFDTTMQALKKAKKKSGSVIKLKPNQISKEFGKLLKKVKITGVRFHDLRHYFASVLLLLNVPDKYSMELMGHSTTNMLRTVYQHTMEEKHTEISNSINAFFEEKVCHEMCHENKKARYIGL